MNGRWALAGVLTGASGLATSFLTAQILGTSENPVIAVGEEVIRLTPGSIAEQVIHAVGHADKPLVITGTLVVFALLFAGIGVLAQRGMLGPVIGCAAMALIGAAAVHARHGSLLSVLVGFLTWIVVLQLLSTPVEDDADRRRFLTLVGGVALGSGVVMLVGRSVGAGRRTVEKGRAALRLTGVTKPVVPAGADQGIKGQQPWEVSQGDFYRIDTALIPPAISPQGWKLRVHGLVDHPMELTFDDLLARARTEAWVTLCCVSNEVGGDLIGNAWWSGVRIAPLLAEAGVQAGADGVLQRSHDGWTCLTPLAALTDDRNAMLAIAMNGEPLPIEHGYPVRSVVPGLYGYVSATKWVVDLEVTRFDRAQGYWTDKGWSALGPVKLASRIDVPRGDVPAGDVVIAGVAWQQHTGIQAVQVQVDGGPWQAATLATEPTVDSWVQWRISVPVAKGPHRVRARAVSRTGEVQTSVQRPPAPNGATGLHEISFEAT